MTQKPQSQLSPSSIRTLANSLPRWFEDRVLMRMYLDAQFFARMYQILYTNADGSPSVQLMGDPVRAALMAVLPHYLRSIAPQDIYTGIDYNTLGSYLQAAAQAGKLLDPSEIQTALNTIHQLITTIPMENAVLATNEFVVEWMINKRTAYYNELHTLGKLTSDQYFDLLTMERARIQTSLKTKETMHRFGHGLDNPPPSVPRLLTGFKRLDATLGGWGQGESTMVATFSGGGKTCMATQASVQALFLNPDACALHIFTEQEHCDMERRIVSQQCKVLFNECRDGIQLDRMTPLQRQNYDLLRREMDHRLVLKKWERGTSVRENLMAIYKQACKQLGRPIQLVTMDWIGADVASMATRPEDVRLIYGQTADAMVLLSEETGAHTISYAQADEKVALNKLHVDNRALRENKSMHTKMTNFIGITGFLKTQDKVEEEISTFGDGGRPTFRDDQFMYMAKSRKSANIAIPILRNFKYQRFEDLSFRRE